ncbi:MAG: hypothetical protein KAQ99_05825, partial [Candidatus Aureabacteria bacterium]|nr:hypothetical protein [Candidatus Auribacterota bacterium]
MRNHQLPINQSTNNGYALLIMTAIISFLAITVMICAFVLSHEANKDERYDITRQRMLDVKRALIGRLTDISGGEDITSCGGFINDYGEPDNIDPFGTGNFSGVLLDRNSVAWIGLPYVYNSEFWAGYRGDCYLDECGGTSVFRDGWGNNIIVRFIADRIEIESWGSDGINDGAPPPADYDRDIVDTFCWRRPQVDITIKNNVVAGANLNVELLYSWRGNVQTELQNHNFTFVGETHLFNFVDIVHGGSGIPVGLRKVVIRDAAAGNIVKVIKMFCLPSG